MNTTPSVLLILLRRINNSFVKDPKGRISLLYSLELLLMNYCIKYNNKKFNIMKKRVNFEDSLSFFDE